MKNHEKAFSDIKNYYNDITLNNLALINTLKVRSFLQLTPSRPYAALLSHPWQEQLEQMRKEQERLEKQLSETQAENRRLQDPLRKV